MLVQYMLSSCVCPSGTSRCSTKTANHSFNGNKSNSLLLGSFKA